MKPEDKDVLRKLAARMGELAACKDMALLRKRWKRHNALDPDGAMILCFPEGAWEDAAGDGVLEIIMKDTHTVQNDPSRLARWVELARREADRTVRG